MIGKIYMYKNKIKVKQLYLYYYLKTMMMNNQCCTDGLVSDETALMDDNRRSSTVNDSSSNLQNAEHDDVDMAALSSMLEQDSDMEGNEKVVQKTAVNS